MTGPAILLDARGRWLQARRQLVTASDVGAILGIDPRRSALQVYAEKIGAAEPEDTVWLRRRRRMEPVIADEFAEQTGMQVRQPDEHAIAIHPSISWLGATLDRETALPLGTGGWFPLELKMVTDYRAFDEWKDGSAPLHYEAQLQIQCACTRAHQGYLCGLLGLDAKGVEVRDRLRDRAFFAAALPILEAFHIAVQRREPPPGTGQAGDAAAVRALWPRDRGKTIALDHEDLARVEEWAAAQGRRDAAEADVKRLDALLRRRLEDAAYGALADGSFLRLTTNKAGHRTLSRWWPRLRSRR